MTDIDKAVELAWRCTLAANLAVGGALCAVRVDAWNGGFDAGWENARHGTIVSGDRWRPGCGRAWGGGA